MCTKWKCQEQFQIWLTVLFNWNIHLKPWNIHLKPCSAKKVYRTYYYILLHHSEPLYTFNYTYLPMYIVAVEYSHNYTQFLKPTYDYDATLHRLGTNLSTSIIHFYLYIRPWNIWNRDSFMFESATLRKQMCAQEIQALLKKNCHLNQAVCLCVFTTRLLLSYYSCCLFWRGKCFMETVTLPKTMNPIFIFGSALHHVCMCLGWLIWIREYMVSTST